MKTAPHRPGSVQRIDTLLAIKAIGLVDGLNANDRRVATALIEHFRRRDGRCDPGLQRIAGLLGISVRTVIRCVNRLVSAGLFKKFRHGGFGNRNRYEPNWDRFAELEEAWRGKFKGKSATPASFVSPDTRQTCHVGADKAVTQTYKSNLPHKTYETRRPTKVGSGWRNGVGGANPAGGSRSRDAVRVEAERRWSADLHRQFGAWEVTYGEIIAAIDAAIQAAATDEEVRRRGGGIEYIRRKLKLGGSRDVR
jgi:hypothetical protein